jgi:hypothetical protein
VRAVLCCAGCWLAVLQLLRLTAACPGKISFQILGFALPVDLLKKRKRAKPSACRGEGSAAAGLQLRVRFLLAALLAMPGTALALQCVSKAA